MPHGWGHDLDGARLAVARERPGVNVNRLASNDDVDPLSGNPFLNGVPVEVAAAPHDPIREIQQDEQMETEQMEDEQMEDDES
jgi:hypothetical protein